MSLYKTLFGVNSFAPVLLKILDIDQPDGKWSSGRFRDIYLNEDGTKIILYTRNGGGNREYCWNDDKVSDCRCPACVMNHHLPKHPNYLTDYEDDFDPTYAYVVFSVPDEYLGLTKALASGEKLETVGEKFINLIEKLVGKDG